MSHRCLTAVLSMIALAPSSAVPATGQAQTVTADRWTVPLTSWGDPDLQGAWTNTTTTPLQRPAELAGKELYTDEERAELDEERARNAGRACATELVVLHRPPPPESTGSYNSFWLEQGSVVDQTSLIVDPPDGRLPPP